MRKYDSVEKSRKENTYKNIIKEYYSIDTVKSVFREFIYKGILLNLLDVFLNIIKVVVNILMIPFFPILAIFIKKANDNYLDRVEEEFDRQLKTMFSRQLTQKEFDEIEVKIPE